MSKPRFCPHCPGLTFEDMTEHADHLQTHQPGPTQWHDAHNLIMQFKNEPSKQVHPVNEELLESIRAAKRRQL